MKNFLLTLSLLAGFAFSAECSGLADLEINYLGTFKSLEDFTNDGDNVYSITLERTADRIDLKPVGCSEGVAVTGELKNAYLPIGENTYTVTTAGISYTIKITRSLDGGAAADTKNTLSDLKVSSGATMFAISPSFSESHLNYSVQIPFKAGNVSVDATLPDYRYGGLIYENEAGNEISNQNISLTPGDAWVMKIKVIAEDATVANGIYTLTLNKMQGNTNNNLASLEVFLDGDAYDNVLLNFNQGVLAYTLTVPNETQTATVKSSKAEQHFGTFEGQNEWIDKPLACGNNAFSITVVAETGTEKTYTLNIAKTCPQPPPAASSSSAEPPPPPPASSSSAVTPPPPPPASSSSAVTPPPPPASSSSAEAPLPPPASSSSATTTPILLPQTAKANAILPMHNAINMQVQGTAKLEIYNLSGKLQKSLNLSNGIYNIPLGNLPKGMYIASAKFSNPENPKIGGNKDNRHLVKHLYVGVF